MGSAVPILTSQDGRHANKQILDYALAQAVTNYNVGHMEGYIGELLAFTPSNITTSHLQLFDKKREAASQEENGSEEDSSR